MAAGITASAFTRNTASDFRIEYRYATLCVQNYFLQFLLVIEKRFGQAMKDAFYFYNKERN